MGIETVDKGCTGRSQSIKQYQQYLKKMIFLPPVLVVFLALLSAVLLIWVFYKNQQESLQAYLIYTFSAYALVTAVTWLIRLGKAGKARLNRNTFYQRYSMDLEFKAFVSIHLSLAVTFVYCIMKAAAGIYYRSAWFGALAFYYIVLGIVRYQLLRSVRGKQEDLLQAEKKYRFCGYMLLVLTLALSVISFYMLYDKRVIVYPGFLIYGAAGYTFYSLTMAVFNLVRYRKLNNPVYSASKMLALAAALVSLFFLQTSMLSVFGKEEGWQQGMNLATAATVFLVILGMAVFMIRERKSIQKSLNQK